MDTKNISHTLTNKHRNNFNYRCLLNPLETHPGGKIKVAIHKDLNIGLYKIPIEWAINKHN